MKFLSKISFAVLVAALVFAFTMPNNAQAQQQTGQVNFGSLIPALNHLDANIQDVQELDDLTRKTTSILLNNA